MALGNDFLIGWFYTKGNKIFNLVLWQYGGNGGQL
jgi:hypothetical protein